MTSLHFSLQGCSHIFWNMLQPLPSNFGCRFVRASMVASLARRAVEFLIVYVTRRTQSGVESRSSYQIRWDRVKTCMPEQAAITFWWRKTHLSCQDSSVVRHLPINPFARGSNLPSANFSHRAREALAFCLSRCRNHEVWSHREKGPWHFPR